MNTIPPDEAKNLLTWSEELLVAININKEPSIKAVLEKAKRADCVQAICTATIATREVWLDAVSSSPDYHLLLKIGREKRVPIISAIHNSREGIVRMMLDFGVDVNARPIRTLRTPLEACVTYNRLDILRLLINEYHASPNLKDPLWQTPLFHALKVRNLEALDLLLGHGADTNAIDSFGHTPLLFFMQDKDLRTLDKEILEHLLNKGADCNKRADRSGMAALHYILTNQNAPSDIKMMVVEMLLERRANADITDSKGRSALHYICDINVVKIDPGSRCKLICLLVQFGADPDIQDENFKSALHLAVESGLPKVVETLTEQNANPKLRDMDGNRPSDLVSKDSGIGSILSEAVEKWEAQASAVGKDVTDGAPENKTLLPKTQGTADSVQFKEASSHLQNRSKRFRTAIDRLEDAIGVLEGEVKTNLKSTYNHQQGDIHSSNESGLDEVDGAIDGVSTSSRDKALNESLLQIQTEFYKLKTYAYSMQQDYNNVMKQLELHTNCTASFDIPNLGQQDQEEFHYRPASPERPDREKTLLYKAIQRVASLVGHDWKMLLRTLEYEETFEVEIIIKEIEEKYRGQLREQAYQSLLHWVQKQGREANLDKLLDALSDCELIDLRDRLEKLREDFVV